MRMWMVDPRGMCRKHLLGEHVELHMAAAHLALGRRVDGWADANCLEPRSIAGRHRALAVEMARRGYQHASPLAQPRISVRQRPRAYVNRAAALAELVRRCPDCAEKFSPGRAGAIIAGVPATSTHHQPSTSPGGDDQAWQNNRK